MKPPIWAILLSVGLSLTSCFESSWTKFPLQRPEATECKDAAEAKHLAQLYFLQVHGLEVNYIPASFSMSRTFETGDWYVIEWIPYNEAGGYPMIFWKDDSHQGRILHWAVARNARGEYITAGDGPRNQLDDNFLGIAKPVGPDRYIGIVKHVFSYRR